MLSVIEMVKHSSALALLGLVVSLATVGMALAYAIKPNEQRLALMRPLSLAAIFGGLSSLAVGVGTVLRGISATGAFPPRAVGAIAGGFADAVMGLFVAFSCLTIAWLLVALGLRRT